jgi:hypothetical protein
MNALLIVLSVLSVQSAATRKLAREVAETFGREAVEAAEPRVLRLVESYGDEAASVLRKAGLPAVQAIERFGAPGLKILGRWGDDGLRLLTMEGDAAVAAVARYGDDAARLMIRHPGVGRQLLEEFGSQALRSQLTTDSVVTLNRLAPQIKSSGRASEILSLVEKSGDRVCDFLWRHKGTIFIASVLATFLHDPQPYLDGVKQLVVQPATDVAREAASRTNWTAVVVLALLVASAWAGIRWGWAPRRSRAVVLDSPEGHP